MKVNKRNDYDVLKAILKSKFTKKANPSKAILAIREIN